MCIIHLELPAIKSVFREWVSTMFWHSILGVRKKVALRLYSSSLSHDAHQWLHLIGKQRIAVKHEATRSIVYKILKLLYIIHSFLFKSIFVYSKVCLMFESMFCEFAQARGLQAEDPAAQSEFAPLRD
jgi:hypothetical protein